MSLPAVHDYDEDAEQGVVYTTAHRNRSNGLAEGMLAEYATVNASHKTAVKVQVGQLPGSVTRSTPQCSVGTTGSGSDAACSTTAKVSVPRYQHRQG